MKENKNVAVKNLLAQALLLVDGVDKELLLLVAKFFESSSDHVPNLAAISKALGLEILFILNGFTIRYPRDGIFLVKGGVFSKITIGDVRIEKRNHGMTVDYEAALLRLPKPMSLDEMKHFVRSIDCHREWKLARTEHLVVGAIENEQCQGRGPVVALGSMVRAGHGWTAPCVQEYGDDSDWTRTLEDRYFANQDELTTSCQYLIVRKQL